LDLFNFGTEAALSLEAHDIGLVVVSLLYLFPGTVYKPGTVVNSDPQICSSVTCSETATLQTSGCGPLEHCQGNGSCVLASTCTVTGPTVIDVHGHMNSIQDRCIFCVCMNEPELCCLSPPSCEMQYSEPADSTINCTSVTERCNLLKEAPFSSCNSHIDPEPYITACTNTLCKYPAVDGLNCQFLKAYARASSLHNHTLDGWTSKTSCSSEAFCQDRTCSNHEFCGKKTVGGDTRCFCRAIFASKYQKNNSLGDPTVCKENSASLTLVGCLLEDKDINYSALQLNDPTCRGQMDELTHMVTFSFNSSNSCGTVVTTNNSYVIYKNTIRSQSYSSGVITRNDQVQIDFSCVHSQPNINTATFRIRDWSIAQRITHGAWNYTLTIKAYTDAARTQLVQWNSEFQLKQKIWMELKTDGLDGSMVSVVTDSCWATDQASPTSSPRHDLIINGCANSADPTVQVEENGLATSTYFSFNMFRFTGGSSDIFLHCQLHLCPKQGNNCIPTCNTAARRHRSASLTYEPEAPAFISVSWTY
uniref:Alpha-tectorin-like n=1 Tax=Neolamprologus brichardi TaxID=32507 RepID=A0A3Q4GAX6_NEOBR